jgi:hypothetical protein
MTRSALILGFLALLALPAAMVYAQDAPPPQTPLQASEGPSPTGGLPTLSVRDGVEPSLNCSPTTFCIIDLQPGEILKGLAVLEPSWKSNVLAFGSESGQVAQILLWPTSWDSTTSVVATTDRRAYSWRATADRLKPLTTHAAFSSPKNADPVRFRGSPTDQVANALASTLDPAKLHLDYDISRHRYAPRIVFDDSVHTYIGWPGRRPPEAPIVLARDEKGETNLLTPHVTPDGNWYILDSIHPHLELRVGDKTIYIRNKDLPR